MVVEEALGMELVLIWSCCVVRASVIDCSFEEAARKRAHLQPNSAAPLQSPTTTTSTTGIAPRPASTLPVAYWRIPQPKRSIPSGLSHPSSPSCSTGKSHSRITPLPSPERSIQPTLLLPSLPSSSNRRSPPERPLSFSSQARRTTRQARRVTICRRGASIQTARSCAPRTVRSAGCGRR